MFRFLRTISVITCFTMLLGTMYAVKKTANSKPKAKPVVKETVIQKPAVVIPEEDILAKYDGGIITKKDLEQKISKIPAQAQSKYKTVQGQQEIFDMMCVEDIFYRKAMDMNLLNDPAVQERINNSKKQLFIQDYYKRNVNNKVSLTEADKQDYYQKNKSEFYVQPYLTILYIQTADEAKAIEALDKLNRGVPFDTVSAHYNINTYAKGVKGKIKNIRLNGYVPGVGNDAEMDKIIGNAQVDTLKYLGPLHTTTGWSIIQVTEKIEGKQRTYLECESEVDQRLRPKKESELLNQIIDRLKASYKVKIDTLSLDAIDLRELANNKANEDKKVVTSSEPTLDMTVKNVLDKFSKMSQQEQMMYIKGSGAKQMVNQDITRSLLYLDAAKDKSYEDSLAVNQDFQQSNRYFVLQEAYKRLVVEKVNVTSDDAREYYNGHPEAYTNPATRKIVAVWCKDQKSAVKAQKKFASAFKKHNQKAIADIIKKFSVKPEQDTLDNIYHNGIVTSIGPDQSLNDLIWTTPVGTVSPVTNSVKKDILFFGVIEEKPAFLKSYTEIEPRIIAQLKKEREKAQMDQVKDQLFTQYNMAKFPEKLEMKLTADELFEMADNSSRQRKYNDSIVYYNQIIKFYPNGKDDYKAAFMKAFLITEEMGNKEEGLKLFKDFIQTYKTGELNESAQYMIDELEGRHPAMDDTTVPESDNK